MAVREPTPPPRRDFPWQPRFGILGLMLITIVASVMAAGGNYLIRTLQGDGRDRLAFVVFMIASPVLLLVIVSVLTTLTRSRPRK